jgi:hypothetical protein
MTRRTRPTPTPPPDADDPEDPDLPPAATSTASAQLRVPTTGDSVGTAGDFVECPDLHTAHQWDARLWHR